MKKIKSTFTIILFSLIMTNTAIGQTKGSWILPYTLGIANNQAHQLEFIQGPIQETGLKVFNTYTPFGYSAGGYAQNGDLLFYIVDKEVYDANTNTSVGAFHSINEGSINAEVQIIRKPNSESVYYIIYSTQMSVGPEERFYYSEVIYEPATGLVSIGDTEVDFLYAPPNHVRGGAFAISQMIDGEGYIYICTLSHGIVRYPVTSDGIDNENFEQVLDRDNAIIGSVENFKAYNFEMKINNSGETIFAWTTMNYLAPDRDKVFIYNMDDDDVKKIDIDPNGTGEIGGIEFSTYEDDILYVSYNASGSIHGIIKLNYENEAITPFFGDDFSHTFLQHAPDGDIYCVSNNGSSLGKISMTSGLFTVNAFSIPGEQVANYRNLYGTDFYILPENEDNIFNVLFDQTNVDCEGNMNGSGSALATGGVPPYTYEWVDDQTGNIISTLPDATGLGVGSYTCCVTDSDLPPVTVCGNVTIVVDDGLLNYTKPVEVVIDATTGSQVWPPNMNEIYKVGIRVTSGYTLEITGNSLLQFGPDAKIVVETAATLIIGNSTLTGHPDCPLMWKGIEVWGDPNYTQYPDPNGVLQQGKLVINGGTIENAEIAVQLSKAGTWNTHTGGIIQANDSYFRNNGRSLLALNYANHHPVYTWEVDNLGQFNNCTFEITNAYIPDVDFYKHIDMNKVDGIKFKGCDFVLQAGVTGVSPWNQAIAAYSAGFDVKAICTSNVQPCNEWDKCTFSGFHKAINVQNTTSVYTFYVDRAEFNNNETGIYASNVQNLSVLFSDFNIAKGTGDVDECEGKGAKASGYGIDMTGCTGFAIEENHFAPSATAGTTIGIRIAETEATDEVYKNYFDGLSYGNYAVGKNWFSNYTWQGLAYYCNENTGNWEDFTVVKNSQFEGGVQNPIGTAELPSGNKFSTNANYNINNNGEYWFGYFYYAPTPGFTNTPYYPEEVYQVTREEVVGTQNSCLSHYGGPSGRDIVLTPEEKQQAEQDFATNLTDYYNVKALYDNLKDGGNTETTLSDVETAWPNDMWELRSELLGKSPHLSMDVLKAAADKTDVLPESIIFEVMAANPDELKKEELIKYLEDKENPLPAYMIDILKQVANGTTYKTVLQRQMAHYNQKKTRAAHDIVRSILNDTITDFAELRNWLDNIGGKRADEQIIASYMQEGNTVDAMSLANMMPALYGYEDVELTEHNYYTEMLNLQITLENQGRTIFDLDSTEVNNLVLIADNSNGTAGTQAKGILEFGYGYHYCDCINGDTSGYKSSGNINYDAFNQVFGSDVEVKPNPAKDWTSFNFTLPDDETEGIIKISNVTGKIIEIFVVNGTQGQKIWDTREVKQGVYLYTFTVNGISKSGKIVISK